MARLSNEEEAGLATRARQGEAAAFLLLRSDNEQELHNYIRPRMYWGGDLVVEDLAEQTWRAVERKICAQPPEGYDLSRGRFATWVKQCFASFKIQDHNRRAGTARPGRAGNRQYTDDSQQDSLNEVPDLRTPSPEEIAVRREAFDRLLPLLFQCGGYPHQQLAFAFSRLIYGELAQRGIRGDSQRTQENHGSTPLEALLETFCHVYQAHSGIRDERLLTRLFESVQPTRKRLPLTVQSLMARDPASLKQASEILERVVADTALQDYYARHAGGYATAIPDWCDKVKRRIQEVLNAPADRCARCNLQDAPPCDDPQARPRRP